MIAHQIPNAFVWTKIQAEAGQSVDRILIRKELERQSGGAFCWGIGESKAEKVTLLAASKPNVEVLFSKMRSSPNPRDSDPDAVLLWEAYETSTGRVPIPPHVVVTSRAHDRKGRLKSRHYALVCANPMCVLRSGGGTLDSGTLRNFGGDGKSIGSPPWSSEPLPTAKASHIQLQRARGKTAEHREMLRVLIGVTRTILLWRERGKVPNGSAQRRPSPCGQLPGFLWQWPVEQQQMHPPWMYRPRTPGSELFWPKRKFSTSAWRRFTFSTKKENLRHA
jgi:hypothetical protein